MPTTDGYWHQLSQGQCLALRQRYRDGLSMDRLASMFGVSRATVGQIIGGRVRPVLDLPDISRGRGRPRKSS